MKLDDDYFDWSARSAIEPGQAFLVPLEHSFLVCLAAKSGDGQSKLAVVLGHSGNPTHADEPTWLQWQQLPGSGHVARCRDAAFVMVSDDPQMPLSLPTATVSNGALVIDAEGTTFIHIKQGEGRYFDISGSKASRPHVDPEVILPGWAIVPYAGLTPLVVHKELPWPKL